MKPKVGDFIRSPRWGQDKYYEVAKIEGNRIYLKTSFGLVEYRIDLGEWDIKPPAIDWTKPIQSVRGKHPLKLIGEWIGRRVVATDVVLFSVQEDGKRVGETIPCVENVPPPPVWPVSKWFVLWESASGQARISGPANSLKGAEANAEHLRKNHNVVHIQEVSFGPPPKS